MEPLTLQTIFRTAYLGFAATRKLSAYLRQAAEIPDEPDHFTIDD